MNQESKFMVDELDMLRQMVQNFNSPLELIREAISNSYDAGANNINIIIKRQLWEGDQRWNIKIRDDGAGMVRDEKFPNEYTGSLIDFFKLGGSSRRRDDNYHPVGEKCLGIKLAFHSLYLKVKTYAGDGFPVWVAECYQPWASIFKHEFPEPKYTKEINEQPQHSFTEIEVVGFYDNDGTHFQADEIEDYILWRTKWGSFENRIKEHLKNKNELLKLHTSKLRDAPTGCITLDAPGTITPREIKFGHPFPDCGINQIIPNQKMEAILSGIDKLPYDQMLEKLDQAKRSHWRYIIEVGTLKELPDVYWQAIISVEGEEAKRNYNPYLRKRQRSKGFSYKAESRYGLWFCKDFFCIEQRNPVAMEILEKEGQRTRFKILLNCQNFLLNNDRNSVGGSDASIIRGIEEIAKELVEKMIEDDSWTWTKIIEEETEIRTSVKQDKIKLQQRSAEISKKPWLMVDNKKIFPQPTTEAETVLLLERLRNLYQDEFYFFDPLDWRTDNGIDSVVKSDEPGENYRFIEFKKDLGTGYFNHTFASLHYIVCWQVKAQDGGILEDTAKRKRTLKRHKINEYNLPQTAPWTLEGEQQTIKVYSLRDILTEKHNLKFVNVE